MAVVYRHRRLDDNSIFYVGIGINESRSFSKRNRNKHWKNITNKTKYSIELILEDLSWEDACELEILLIELYGRNDLGLGKLVNMTNGGDGNNNIIVTDEARLKMSKNNGKYWLGKSHSEETKQKISKNRKGKILSPENKIKQIEGLKKAHKEGKFDHLKGRTPWNKGISPSPETLEKQRLKKLGVKRKPHSEETKQKMRESAFLKNKNKLKNES